MDVANVCHAARLLAKARQTGEPLWELPQECKPSTVAEVNAIIDEVTRQLGESIAGWKITFLYKPRQKPFRAPLYASRIFASPASVPLSLTPSLLIEPEITFRLLHDLPPRATAYRSAEVAEAVVACPSLEIVDTRFDTRHRGIRQMLDDKQTLLEANADNITNGAFVVGEGRRDWQEFDFAEMRVQMRSQGRVIVESVGGHAFVDPFPPVVVLANELRHDQGLQAGHVVATGSFTGFYRVEPDQPVVVDFAGFGIAEATFSSH